MRSTSRPQGTVRIDTGWTACSTRWWPVPVLAARWPASTTPRRSRAGVVRSSRSRAAAARALHPLGGRRRAGAQHWDRHGRAAGAPDHVGRTDRTPAMTRRPIRPVLEESRASRQVDAQRRRIRQGLGRSRERPPGRYYSRTSRTRRWSRRPPRRINRRKCEVWMLPVAQARARSGGEALGMSADDVTGTSRFWAAASGAVQAGLRNRSGRAVEGRRRQPSR